MTSFSKKIINLRFVLGTGDFGMAGQNTLDLKGLRVSATIGKMGLDLQTTLDMQIWGMTLDQMQALTVLNRIAMQDYRRNYVVLSAGDEDGGVAVAFQGTIQEAWADGRSPPDMAFHVTAFSGLFEFSDPIPPTSYKGGIDAGTLFQGFATQLGYGFANNGVTGVAHDAYYAGDLKTQIERAAKDLNCDMMLDSAMRTLTIWPKGQARADKAIDISAATGMEGYPSFTEYGVQFRTLYNPNLSYGRLLNVDSVLKPASGQWIAQGITHYLDCEMPDGQWHSEVICSRLGFTAA